MSTIGTEECLSLQESILRIDFILNLLFLSDIMFHLTICSKIVQSSCYLPWDFTKAIENLQTLDSCLITLDSCIENQSLELLNNVLFPNL